MYLAEAKAIPLFRFAVAIEVFAQTCTFEVRIESGLLNIWVIQPVNYFIRDSVIPGHVNHSYRTIVTRVGEKQDLKVVGLDITIRTALP